MPTPQSLSRQVHLIPAISLPNRLYIPIVQGIYNSLFTPYDFQVGDGEFVIGFQVFAVVFEIYRCRGPIVLACLISAVTFTGWPEAMNRRQCC